MIVEDAFDTEHVIGLGGERGAEDVLQSEESVGYRERLLFFACRFVLARVAEEQYDGFLYSPRHVQKRLRVSFLLFVLRGELEEH